MINTKLPIFLSIALLAMSSPLFAQSSEVEVRAFEWPSYGADAGHTRYAPLSQINADNFSDLQVAWRFKTDNMGPQPEFNFQSTPLMVNGVLYTTGGTRRAVTALDAETGEQYWLYSLDEGERSSNAPRRLSGRGLAYWTDGTEERILYVTPGYQLIALDASTGRPIVDFGLNGIIDLRDTLDQNVNYETDHIGLHSPPAIAKNVVVVGAAHSPFAPPDQKSNVNGYVRGFDVISGELLWTFHTVPQPGELGYETWLEGSAQRAGGNSGVWATISIDEDLELVYLPVESPYSDMYGGLRPGDNLFGESLVAVDLNTGERVWHYQLSHHALWDHDIPSAPIFVNAVKDGRIVKAVAQATKQGFLFVFDRATGEPVWPIEEQPVPAGDVPGEWYSPTQPIPSIKYGHQGVALDDLIDFTPELRAEAERLVESHRMGPIYTPPVLANPDGPISTLSVMGGSNWPGGAYDPESNIVYVTAGVRMLGISICEYAQGSELPYGICFGEDLGIFGAPPLTVQGLPLLKPPYGTIAAIDMTDGQVLWEIPNGETPDEVKNHPALAGLDIERTGRQGTPGALVTKSLLIVAEPGFGPTPNGRRGSMLRAYDKATGLEVDAIQLPAPQSGSPMTYMVNGIQYLVIAVSGSGYSGELIAFKAPVAGSESNSVNTINSEAGQAQMLDQQNIWQGVYTDNQALRGNIIYTENCIDCHGAALQGVEMSPALTGFTFNSNWNGQTLKVIQERINTMPPTTPGSLTSSQTLDVIAYILSEGNFPAGNVELGNSAGLERIYFSSTFEESSP